MKLFLYHIFVSTIWIAAFIKLFFFDFDVYLVEQLNPDLIWILQLRLFFIIVAILIFWFYSSNVEFIKGVLFVIFYPFILIGWTIPVSLFLKKRWFLTFTYLSAVASTISNLKKNLFLLLVFGIATSIILNVENEVIIYTSIFCLLAFTLYLLINKIKLSFSPSSIFAINTSVIIKYFEGKNLSLSLLKNYKEEMSKDGVSMSFSDSTDITKIESVSEFKEKAPILILFNKSLLFLSEMLNRFKKSRAYIAFFGLSILLTICICVIIFSLINFAIFKIDDTAFIFIGSPDPLLFIYYSFNALFLNSITSMEPIASFAIIVNMYQKIFGTVLIVVMIGILISVNTERYNEDIDQIINVFNQQSDKVEKTMNIYFKLSIQQVTNEFENSDHFFAYVIRFLESD